MARVIDLTATDEAGAILERTKATGLLSGGSRSAEPLSTYLADGEVGRYLARNKAAGLTIEGPDGERTMQPGGDFRTTALLTDRRLLFVAGRADGDETVPLPLADVIDVAVESSGLRTAELVIEAADDRTYRFPCRGDLEPMAATISDDAAAWSHAERLLEDADHDVGRARERLGMGEYDVAFDVLADADGRWAEALETLESVHEAAVRGLRERVDVRREMAAGLRRQIKADAGAGAHATAEAAWDERDYEAAARNYDRALAGYEEALDFTGSTPAAEQLRRRLAGVAAERAILERAPIADAETAKLRAQATDDADVRAAAWEEALERFRDALGLRWDGDGEFHVDTDETREAAAAAADAAIEARREAGRQWLAAADKLAATQGVEAASRVYDRARAHFEDALGLARAVFPEREDEIEDLLAEIDRRQSGEVDPADVPTDAPLPVDSVAEALDVLSDDVELPPAGRDDAPAVAASNTSGAEASAGQEASGPVDAATAIDPPAEDSPDDGAGTAPPALGSFEDRSATVEPAALLPQLAAMQPTAFRELVADVWDARGWATTVFTTSGAAVYDVLGAHEGSGERLLLWTVQAPADERLDQGVIERCRTTLDRSQGATRATVVTIGTVEETTRNRAAELDVEVVDGETLCQLLAATDLLDRVPDT